MCCCINARRIAIHWLSWAVISLMLTSWDGIGAGLREREIEATWAWRLLSIWVVVSAAAVPFVESEDTVGWLLGWVGGPGTSYSMAGG